MAKAMKDSGIEWIGEIPEDWQVTRLRFLCKILTGNKDTINRNDEGKYSFYVRSPIIERIDTYSYDGEAILMAGDGVGAGKVFHYAIGKFDYHQRVYNLHEFNRIHAKYLYYYLQENFRKEIEQSNAKSTVDSIRLPMLLNFPILITDTSKQQAIADYLDRKCSLIDSTIEKQKAVIEKLKLYKQSIITEAVTKGLDPNVKMKDSGIEWIGEIPEGWETAKIKYFLNKITDGAHVSPETDNGVYNFVSVTDLLEETIDFGNCLKTSMTSYEWFVRTGCKPIKGDVLLSKDGTVGKSVVVNDNDDFVVASSLIILSPKLNLNSRYLNYLIKSDVIQEQLKQYLKGTGLKRVSVINASKLIGIFPDVLTQQAIVDYLNTKCSQIDTILTDKQKLVDKLTDYKKSLIYECVTGKREVI